MRSHSQERINLEIRLCIHVYSPMNGREIENAMQYTKRCNNLIYIYIGLNTVHQL